MHALTAAAKEKELAQLVQLERKGRAVPAGVLDPLMAVLVQARAEPPLRCITLNRNLSMA